MGGDGNFFLKIFKGGEPIWLNICTTKATYINQRTKMEICHALGWPVHLLIIIQARLLSYLIFPYDSSGWPSSRSSFIFCRLVDLFNFNINCSSCSMKDFGP